MARQRSNQKSKRRNTSYVPPVEQVCEVNKKPNLNTNQPIASVNEGKGLNDDLPEELEDSIDFGGSNDVSLICNPIQKHAYDANVTGNEYKYKAIGWMVCWIVFAVLNKKFLAHAFRYFSKKSEDQLFYNTARLCLVLDVDRQSSTILKYGKATKHYYNIYKEEITLDNYGTIAEVIANQMKLDGGFLQFEPKRKSGGSGKRLTKAQFEERVNKLKAKPHIATFKAQGPTMTSSNVLLFLGCCDDDEMSL